MTYDVPETLPCFEGHFPGNPILPAVMILDECARILGGRATRRLRSAKFVGAVLPGMRVEIAIRQKSESDWDVEWSHEGKKLVEVSFQLS